LASFQRQHVGLDIAEGGQRFLDDALREVIDDVLLEVRLARMVRADTVALLVREAVIGDAEHVHLDAGGH
jgi:hypothetical protein